MPNKKGPNQLQQHNGSNMKPSHAGNKQNKGPRNSQSLLRSSFAPGNGSRQYHLLAKETLQRETSSSFVSMPGFFVREGMKNISLMRPLHEGIPVLKLSTSGKLQKRVLTLSSCQQTLFLTHSKVAPETKACMLKTPFYTPSRGFGKNEAGNIRYLRYLDVADLQGFCVGVISNQLLEENIQAKNVPSLVTIFHQDYFGKKYTNLVIGNPAHRMGLIAALQLMKRMYEESQQWVSRSVLLMRYIWYDVDRDISQLVTKEQFARICARINLNVKDAKDAFKDFRQKENISQSSLTYGECMRLMESLQSNNEVAYSIWKRIFGKTPLLSAKSLLEFLHNVQGERDSDLTDAKDLIAILNHIEMPPDHALVDVANKLDKARFVEYLLGPLNDAFDPSHQELPTRKLTKPLSHYWINSSHNTYLTGDQLKSKSSVESYLYALRRGCKCIELDCWDGPQASRTGNELQIDVYHGHTLTSKISFLSIILLVNNYLISNPDSYPIILSLENHCSPPYQNQMAEVLKKTLGNKLFIPTAASRKEEMPSPEKLKGRVLVKGKQPPEADDEYDDKSENQDLPKYEKSLLDLIYFHGTKFKKFEDSCGMIPSNMHSIGESKVTKIAEKNPILWRKYNIDHMTRIYPAGIRVDSSNYNPVFAWSLGCQKVALNFQTRDTNMILNDGRFRENGGCGYVAKPSSVMNGKKPEQIAIKIRVLCGSCLPKPNGERQGEKIDPYVQVELHDVLVRKQKEEYQMTSHSTHSAQDNGYSPVWKDEGYQFLVHHADVAMVVFKVINQVIDQDVIVDDPVACAAIPVTSLRQGFRSVQLHHYDNHRVGPYKMASLLVQIQMMKKSDKTK